MSSYTDFLKRTGQAPSMASMSDNEIHDFIQQNIRQYASDERDWKW
ncbi:MAG: hypothetical protein KJZ78_05740 [Bryobacteraceae bacterium]|nr:hypothetical protein [Bryobacteraceae bacterium]